MKRDILGVLFDCVTMKEAVSAGADSVRGEGFHYVVTPNPEIVNLARKDGGYRDILNKAFLVLPDGIGVVYAGKILGQPLKERVPGIDFATGILTEMAKTGGRLYLLGAKPGVAEQAAENLKKTYPGLVLCGTGDGYFKDPEVPAREIRKTQADAVFVCLGAPKQEEWMVDFGPETGAKLMIGLGGALDVFAGHVKRAPEIWQKMGLEWFYRLLCQPSRIGRMAKLPLFLWTALKYRMTGKEE